MNNLQGVPTLDLRGGCSNKNVNLFGQGLREFGFVNVIHHGVRPAALARAYDVSKRTFDLPLATKQRYEFAVDGRATGYTSPRIETAQGSKVPDLKEFWHVRHNAPPENLRYPAEVPDFVEATTDLTRDLDVLSGTLLTMLEMFLGLPMDTLVSMVKDGPSLLRLLHYFGLDGTEPGIRAEAHTDINLITFLPAATSAGLEVQTRDGIWLPVNNPPDSVIVNAGDMLEVFTDFFIRSTLHRVVNLDGKPRYSMPYFVHPRGDVVLRADPRLTAHDFLMQRLREIGLIV